MNGVPVSEGLFTVQPDFGGAVFNGEARWLEIEVDCGSGAATLSPRQPVTPAPYALALPGLRTVQNILSPNILGGWKGNGTTLVGLQGVTISGGGQAGGPNQVGGHYGTVGGGALNTAGGLAATVGGGWHNEATNS